MDERIRCTNCHVPHWIQRQEMNTWRSFAPQPDRLAKEAHTQENKSPPTEQRYPSKACVLVALACLEIDGAALDSIYQGHLFVQKVALRIHQTLTVGRDPAS